MAQPLKTQHHKTNLRPQITNRTHANTTHHYHHHLHCDPWNPASQTLKSTKPKSNYLNVEGPELSFSDVGLWRRGSKGPELSFGDVGLQWELRDRSWASVTLGFDGVGLRDQSWESEWRDRTGVERVNWERWASESQRWDESEWERERGMDKRMKKKWASGSQWNKIIEAGW